MGHQSHCAFTMQPSSLFSLVVLLALDTVASWTEEGSKLESAKAGACPYTPTARCSVVLEPQCQNDWHCPKMEKCCTDSCGTKCVEPVAIMNPVEKKPGRCLKPYFECLMLNPPNYCETDGECASNYKCCKGMCGKLCVPPM